MMLPTFFFKLKNIIMSKKITIYEYISTNVPADAHFVINKFGSYRKARNQKELEYQLKDFVKTYGSNGLKALSEIHPDKQLIEVDCHSCKQKEETISQLKTDSLKVIEKEPMSYFNATGDNNEKLISKISNNMFVVGGFIILGVALLLKQNKN